MVSWYTEEGRNETKCTKVGGKRLRNKQTTKTERYKQ